MKEENIVKRQLIKGMLLNFIAFSLIFSTLGCIIYSQVSSSLYSSSNQELLNNKNRTAIMQDFQINKNENKLEDLPENFNSNIPDISNNKQKIQKNIQAANPRLMYIFRNKNGEIIEEKGKYDQTYFEQIKFDNTNLDQIYDILVDNQYKYRAVNYKIQQNDEEIYVQILINVDAENDIIMNFSKTLIISIVICIILSLVASYILSKRTLKPIIDSWKKQTEFVQNASHELRTPLTIIQAKQELLLEEPQSKIIDKAKEITISLNETKRLSKLVKDLMVLARADSNKTNLKIEKIDIDNMIRNSAEPFQELANSQKKKFVIDLNYKKEINIDKFKIQQVLVILLDNAIKYTEKDDQIEINTLEKDGKFILEVSDTGIGISEEGINHIFERFYREDKARNRETGGSGLGLSIAYSIINVHGGTIKVEHNKPKGTKFEIKLK